MPAVSSRATSRIDFDGPFFKADVEKTFFQNLQHMFQALAEEGSQVARLRLSTGSERRALVRMTDDRVADHVVGRTVSIRGKQWSTAAVVQVSTEGMSRDESVSLMAAASVVERRTRAISGLTTQIRRGMKAVTQANLTKGLE